MLYNKETGLRLFELGDILELTDKHPNYDNLKILGKLRFIKYNSTERELCLVMDDQGSFWSFYREFLRSIND